MPTAPTPSRLSRPGLVVFGLLFFLTWAISHSYRGIVHDAGLYTLQALSHIHPESLSADVFLKFGSQDRFTVFSPIYAATIRLIGVEPAAALLTLLFQCALLASAWMLARTVMSRSMALLGIAVLIAIPCDYGAERVLTCFESFLTPRMAAEALTLGGLAAAMSTKRLWAAALLTLAAFFHPAMAAAGFVAVLVLFVAISHPRTATGLAAFGLLAISVQAIAMPSGEWGRFDDLWLNLVRHRSPYLFLGSWRLDDWSRAVVTLTTLVSAASTSPNPRARNLSLITLVTLSSGLALSWFACDLLHLVLFTQVQPWRWQWLGRVVAAVVLPETLRVLWGREVSGRTTALLLVAAWIFASNVSALAAAVASLASLAFLQRLKPSESRWVFYGAWGLLLMAIVWWLASNLEFTTAYYLEPSIPLWDRRIVSFMHDGIAPLAIMALTWCLARTPRGQPGLMVLGMLAVAACGVALPLALRGWTTREFTPQRFAQFAPLRQVIPPRSEVLWPESPVGVWIVLDKPSYVSTIQSSGMIFSRRAALELKRRADALGSAIDPDTFMIWRNLATGITLSRQQLKQACATNEFEFLVTPVDLGVEPMASVPSANGPASKKIRLYRCQTLSGPQARAAAAST